MGGFYSTSTPVCVCVCVCVCMCINATEEKKVCNSNGEMVAGEIR